MEFKVGDVVRIKESVVGGYTYDGYYVDPLNIDAFLNDNLLIVKSVVDSDVRKGEKLLSFYGTAARYPANIFNKVGEIDVDNIEKNTTHYMKSKRYYPNVFAYLTSVLK